MGRQRKRNALALASHVGPERAHDTQRRISQQLLPDAAAEFIRTILDHGHAGSTKRLYRMHLTYFWGWAKEALGLSEHYPVSVEMVLQFISDHLGGMDKELESRLIAKHLKHKPGPHALSTVEVRLVVLGIAHRLHEAPNPCKDKIVRQVLRNARRAYGHKVRQKKAITTDILSEMLDTCDKSLVGLRDRALLLLGFSSGGRRRSEIVAFEASDLTPVPGGYLLRMRRSKTDQAGEGKDVPLLGTAAKALAGWLKAADIRNGRIFRSILPGKKLGESLGDRQVARIVKRRIIEAGYDPRDFSAHSLRAGFMTSAGRAGIHLGDAMQMSGHKTIEIALKYFRPGTVLTNPAASLVDKKLRDTT